MTLLGKEFGRRDDAEVIVKQANVQVAEFEAYSPDVTAYIGRDHKMFIAGEWRHAVGGETLPVFDPATGNKHGHIPAGGPLDVDLAVNAARRAFESPEWSRMKPAGRQQLMLDLADLVEKNFDELVELETRDNGKPIGESQIDVNGVTALMRYMAGWATKIGGRTTNVSVPGDHFAYTAKEPVGVVGAIIPWNFPLGMASWKIVPALVTGCTIVLKPAEQTSLSVLRLAELAEEAGFPKGVLNVVTGTGASAGAALASHPGIDKIAFTGSTGVGRAIAHAAADTLARVTLELGGKSPVIVLADSDTAAAAQGAAGAIFFNQGQVCTAGSRLYVHQDIYDEVIADVAAIADGIRLAPGVAPGCQMGPLISSEQQVRVEDYIDIGISEGASVATSADSKPDAGFFVRPTVLADTSDEMRVVNEEIFGPVLVAAPFKDEAAVIEAANASNFGLSASIWSNDLRKVHRMVPRIRAGIVWVNTHNPVDPSLPFGGVKHSGYGRELGPEQLDAYLETKSVWMSY